MWLFNQFLKGSIKAVVWVRVTLTHSANAYHKVSVESSSAIAQLLLKHYVTYDDIAEMDAEMHNFRQGSITAVGYAEELWTRTL